MRVTLKHKNLFEGKTIKLEVPISDRELEDQMKEILEYEIYKPDKKKNKVIVDIGANIGLASLYLSQFADKVYAIEPSPEIYQALVKNVKGKKFVTCGYAITALPSERTLLPNSSTASYSPPQTFFPNEFQPDGGEVVGESVIVPCIPINQFVEANKIDHIDVLKIDVEGSEYEIMMSEGFEKVADKIDMIVGEAHFTPNGGGFPQAIPDILKLYGFKTTFIQTPECNYKEVLKYKNSLNGFERTVIVKLWTNFVAKR